MSQLVYPALPGLSFGVQKTALWNTMRKNTPSGRQYRGTFQTTPTWRYKLTYEFLRDSNTFPELKTLAGFFNKLSGGFDTFLFTDPDDSTATTTQFGVGDGATKNFQLVRTLGGFSEPVYDLNGAASIYVNGVLQGSGYTVSASGLVTFTSAPAAAAVLTWSGAYYWRCAFDADDLAFGKFMQQLWEAKTVQFTTVKP